MENLVLLVATVGILYWLTHTSALAEAPRAPRAGAALKGRILMKAMSKRDKRERTQKMRMK
jgi:hypothetical protein